MERLTYAIGDIHGRLDLLEMAAEAIEADLSGRLGHVICLGDYVDRGPDSRGVVEFLMEAQREGAVTCLKGNHEDMMVEALRGGDSGLWLVNGGTATLASYGAGGVPEEHIAWMDGLPAFVGSGDRLFVHAGFMPGVPIGEQEPDVCMWIRDRFLVAERDFAGWPHIVHGHTPQHSAKPKISEPELLSWRTNLDTGAFYTGVLTVAVFDDNGGPPVRTISVSDV